VKIVFCPYIAYMTRFEGILGWITPISSYIAYMGI
jgi:hypothetical protein